MHNYGLAADVAPYSTGDSGDINWDETFDQFKKMVESLKVQGMAWGGDRVHFKDYDRFQLSSVPASPGPAMIADCASGDEMTLKSLWANVDNGIYSVSADNSLGGQVWTGLKSRK